MTPRAIRKGLPFAIRLLDEIEYGVYETWARFGIAAAGISYAAIMLTSFFLNGELIFNLDLAGELLTIVACGVGYVLAARGSVEKGALLTLGVIWLELHISIAEQGIQAPGVVVFPGVVVGAGLLMGGVGAFGFAGATAVSALVAATQGAILFGEPARSVGSQAYAYAVLLAVLIAVAAFIDFSMRALGAVVRSALASEQRVSDLILHAPDGILALDAEGRIGSANPVAQRLLGFGEEELLGKVAKDMLVARVEPDARTEVAALFEGPEATADFALSGPESGRHYLEARSTRFTSIDGKEARQVTLHDATERVHAARLEREMQERLEESNRLDAVGRLAGGIAHEFNNNLTVIGGFAELLLADGPDQETKDLAGGILDMQQRATSVTKRLLAFARKDFVQPTRVSLSSVVEDTRPIFMTVLGQGVELETRCPAVPEVLADPQQVEHLLVNLLVNAKDAQQGVGKVTIAVTPPGATSAGRVGEPLKVPEGFVEVRVDDPGPGMDEDAVSRAFEPFYSGGPFGESPGMGLATVHGIVVQNGGSVSLDSEVGAGTTVRILWPLAAAA